jgi:DNA-binding response OmpR family regulator
MVDAVGAMSRLQRVLILDPNLANAKLLTDLLRSIWPGFLISSARDADQARTLAERIDPQLIFVEASGPSLDGIQFVRDLRRSHLPCRQAPVIVITAEAKASVIVAARNAGVHEFLRRPFTMRDLARRLEAVALHPRDWVEAVGYVGPDRRRFNSGEYQGQRKRRSDAGPATSANRIEQALRITKFAIAALENDPAQALRSLQVQASELKALAIAMPNAKLGIAASKLQTVLSGASAETGLFRPAIEAAAADLWAFLPAEAPANARAVA